MFLILIDTDLKSTHKFDQKINFPYISATFRIIYQMLIKTKRSSIYYHN